MRSGTLLYSLDILRPQVVTNDFGEERTEWEQVNALPVPAERVRLTPRAGVEAGERFPACDAEFNVRSSVPVEENWRVSQRGGWLYTVENITPNLRRGYLTLSCSRVND